MTKKKDNSSNIQQNPDFLFRWVCYTIYKFDRFCPKAVYSTRLNL